MSNLTATDPKAEGVARGASGTDRIRRMCYCPTQGGRAIPANVGDHNAVRGPAAVNLRR